MYRIAKLYHDRVWLCSISTFNSVALPGQTIDNTRNKGLATRIATIRQSSLRSRDLLCNLCASIVIDTATRQNECSALSFPVLLFRYLVVERNYSCNQYRS